MSDAIDSFYYMNMILLVFLSITGFAIGGYIISAIRKMMRARNAWFLFDWRRFFSKERYVFDRENDPSHFWSAILFNSFFAVITLSLSILVLGAALSTMIAILLRKSPS